MKYYNASSSSKSSSVRYLLQATITFRQKYKSITSLNQNKFFQKISHIFYGAFYANKAGLLQSTRFGEHPALYVYVTSLWIKTVADNI
jgi:hypothetical protein